MCSNDKIESVLKDLEIGNIQSNFPHRIEPNQRQLNHLILICQFACSFVHVAEVRGEAAEGGRSERGEGHRGSNFVIKDVLHEAVTIRGCRAVVIATHKANKPIKSSLKQQRVRKQPKNQINCTHHINSHYKNYF